jgi:hypothetical protein
LLIADCELPIEATFISIGKPQLAIANSARLYSDGSPVTVSRLMSNPNKSLVAPPPLVALAGWLVPGAGYWLIGQPLRGLVVGVTILLIFVGGLLIGGMHVIDAPTGLTPQLILQKPWFIGQVLAGPVTLVSSYLANNWGMHVDPATLKQTAGVALSHARVNEIGVLYTAVAGMLNLMALIDAAYRSANEGAR